MLSKLRSVQVLSDATDVIRPVSLCLATIAVTACAMALSGLHATSILLGGVLVVLAGVIIFYIYRAISELHGQSTDLHAAAIEAEGHYVKVLRRIVRIVEGREKYTQGHSQRIGQLAERIARKLGMPRRECELLNLAGQLHDIGILAISEGLLNKRTHLGAEEFRAVQKHAEISYEILLPLSSLHGALEAVRYHHERLNGTGYPAGLVGKEIPIGARILAVADAYDAMTHDRPQRAAMSPLRAMEELQRCTPVAYDLRCVEALASLVHLPKLRHAMAPEPAAAVGA